MTGPLGPEGFVVASGVSRETRGRLEAYADLLTRWQARINLVSPASLSDLWRRHMLDSAQLRPLVPAGAATLVDLGSGAGFPGLVLAILLRHEDKRAIAVRLVESDQRKGAFLREAARVTGTEVEVVTERIEAAPAIRADLVTARALKPLPELFPLAARFMDSASMALLPKGRGVEAELAEARQGWRFRHRAVPSRSGPDGVVLVIEDLVRVR